MRIKMGKSYFDISARTVWRDKVIHPRLRRHRNDTLREFGLNKEFKTRAAAEAALENSGLNGDNWYEVGECTPMGF